MTSRVPESGSLREHSLPQILLDLHGRRFLGTLELSRGRTTKCFVVQDGALIGSESTIEGEALPAVLHDMGTLSAEARRQAEQRIRKTGCAEAAALLSAEGIEPRQIFDGIREQIRRRAVECFGWGDGSFTLCEGSERNDQAKALGVDPLGLVQAGLQAHWGPDRFLETLAPHMNEYTAANPRLGKVVRRLTLDATVERMVAGLSGKQTLGTIIGAAAGSPAALSTFWVLDAAGALDYSETPPAAADEEAAPEIEIQVTGAEAAAETTAAPTSSAARASESAASAPSPEAEKMRAEVLDRLERLDSLTFYELLDIEPDAAQGAVRKAYFLAAKRYHPDAIARLGLQDLRSEAGEVFARIAEANEVLADPDRRKSYDQQLEGGMPEIDVQVLAQAETFYRKGEILINMGDFRGALDYLQNAVDLYPHECAYQSDLAWAFFKKNPPEPEKALEHIRLALELDPEDAEARFRLGVIEGTE